MRGSRRVNKACRRPLVFFSAVCFFLCRLFYCGDKCSVHDAPSNIVCLFARRSVGRGERERAVTKCAVCCQFAMDFQCKSHSSFCSGARSAAAIRSA